MGPGNWRVEKRVTSDTVMGGGLQQIGGRDDQRHSWPGRGSCVLYFEEK